MQKKIISFYTLNDLIVGESPPGTFQLKINNTDIAFSLSPKIIIYPCCRPHHNTYGTKSRDVTLTAILKDRITDTLKDQFLLTDSNQIDLLSDTIANLFNKHAAVHFRNGGSHGSVTLPFSFDENILNQEQFLKLCNTLLNEDIKVLKKITIGTTPANEPQAQASRQSKKLKDFEEILIKYKLILPTKNRVLSIPKSLKTDSHSHYLKFEKDYDKFQNYFFSLRESNVELEPGLLEFENKLNTYMKNLESILLHIHTLNSENEVSRMKKENSSTQEFPSGTSAKRTSIQSQKTVFIEDTTTIHRKTLTDIKQTDLDRLNALQNLYTSDFFQKNPTHKESYDRYARNFILASLINVDSDTNLQKWQTQMTLTFKVIQTHFKDLPDNCPDTFTQAFLEINLNYLVRFSQKNPTHSNTEKLRKGFQNFLPKILTQCFDNEKCNAPIPQTIINQYLTTYRSHISIKKPLHYLSPQVFLDGSNTISFERKNNSPARTLFFLERLEQRRLESENRQLICTGILLTLFCTAGYWTASRSLNADEIRHTPSNLTPSPTDYNTKTSLPLGDKIKDLISTRESKISEKNISHLHKLCSDNYSEITPGTIEQFEIAFTTFKGENLKDLAICFNNFIRYKVSDPSIFKYSLITKILDLFSEDKLGESSLFPGLILHKLCGYPHLFDQTNISKKDIHTIIRALNKYLDKNQTSYNESNLEILLESNLEFLLNLSYTKPYTELILHNKTLVRSIISKALKCQKYHDLQHLALDLLSRIIHVAGKDFVIYKNEPRESVEILLNTPTTSPKVKKAASNVIDHLDGNYSLTLPIVSAATLFIATLLYALLYLNISDNRFSRFINRE